MTLFCFNHSGSSLIFDVWALETCEDMLGPPVVPFYPFLGEGPLLKKTTEKKGTLILTSLLEDLV